MSPFIPARTPAISLSRDWKFHHTAQNPAPVSAHFDAQARIGLI
jgi:hypothetical protein